MQGGPPVRKWIALSVVVVAVLGLVSGASAQIIKPKATVTSPEGKSIEEAQQEAYDGPKARVAVSRFTDKTGKGWWTGQIGDGMADMLATALFHSNRFIVLERQTLGDVLKEQDLGAAGRIKKGTEAPVGEIEGAELLITGAVTEFQGRFFCPTCGSSVFGQSEDEIELAVGSLDAPNQLRPSYELWIQRREDWLPEFALARRYEGNREGQGRSEP